ncbi:hypothetical protein OSTOST_01584, partial [Ostertagia ostertagi]
MRLLGWSALVLCLSLSDASSLLSKTINADGSREFRIAKQIKHNTCLCQCRCVPEKMDLFGNRPAAGSSRESLEVDDNAAKDQQKLKTSMVQELAAATTQPINVTLSSTSSKTSTSTQKVTETVPVTSATTTEITKETSEIGHDSTTLAAATETTAATSSSTSTSTTLTSTSELPPSSPMEANATDFTASAGNDASTSAPEVLDSIDAKAVVNKEDIPIPSTTLTPDPTTTLGEENETPTGTTDVSTPVAETTTEAIITESMD